MSGKFRFAVRTKTEKNNMEGMAEPVEALDFVCVTTVKLLFLVKYAWSI